MPRTITRDSFLIYTPLVVAMLLPALVDLEPGHPVVTRTAAVGFLMAGWWVTGAVPLAATALLPLALFPPLGIMDARDTAAQYFNDTIALYLGGFLMALAMERWGLHKRIALRFLAWCGVRPSGLILGFLAPTFFVSMWISNIATAMMMLPIALSVIARIGAAHPEEVTRRHATSLLLAVAYGASLGGIATPIGTAPNLSLIRIMAISFPGAPEVTFASWTLFAFPLAATLMFALWAYLSYTTARKGERLHLDPALLRDQYRALGRMSFEERVVLAGFGALCLLWLTRTGAAVGPLALPGWSRLFAAPEYVRDGTVAIAVSFLLFLIPARSEPGKRVLDWDVARNIPWDIVLLFGGGFALAQGIAQSGLAAWLGHRLEVLGTMPPPVLLFAAIMVGASLTQLTSNTATTEMLLPIVAALCVVTRTHPFFLMIPVTIACSFAFMFPAGTPPNAVIFGTGHLRIADMARAGIVLTILGVLLLTGAMMLYGRWIYGIDFAQFPEWAVLAKPK